MTDIGKSRKISSDSTTTANSNEIRLPRTKLTSISGAAEDMEVEPVVVTVSPPPEDEAPCSSRALRSKAVKNYESRGTKIFENYHATVLGRVHNDLQPSSYPKRNQNELKVPDVIFDDVDFEPRSFQRQTKLRATWSAGKSEQDGNFSGSRHGIRRSFRKLSKIFGSNK